MTTLRDINDIRTNGNIQVGTNEILMIAIR